MGLTGIDGEVNRFVSKSGYEDTARKNVLRNHNWQYTVCHGSLIQ